MTRFEKVTLLVTALLSLVLRGLAFFRYRFDSDEPQHLHVAWGWTAGLVQYRDYFDNHAPLFHMLSAPLVALLGERPTILLYMRAAMLPLFAVIVVLTWWVARRLYSTRVALWSAVLLTLFPPFFLKSLEYRTDNLWNTLWMVAFAIVVAHRPTPLRWFFTGLVFGTALAVSMKTPLLVATLVLSAIIVSYVRGQRLLMLKPLLAAAAGFVVVPAVIAVTFVRLHAWQNLMYCVFDFNTLVARERPHAWVLRLLWPVLMALVIFAARRSPGMRTRQLFCWVSLGVFFATLFSFWILISPRDMLPMMPVASVLLAGEIDAYRRRVAVYAATAILFAALLFQFTRGFANQTDEYITMMNQALRLTRPGEMVMDLKGETVYRRRPYYYIFELITRTAIAHGLIPDRVPEAVVEHRCYVAQADGPMFPPRARDFLSDNFLDLGRLRAAGQWLDDDGSFTIAVPGPYVVIGDVGLAIGELDAVQQRGARELQAGRHLFTSATPGQRLAVLWAPAFYRGFSPFHLQDRQFPRRWRWYGGRLHHG